MQTHIKAFGHQTSLVQSSWEHFHFKLHKLSIFLGYFCFVTHIPRHLQKRRTWEANISLFYGAGKIISDFLLCLVTLKPPWRTSSQAHYWHIPVSQQWPTHLASKGAQRTLSSPIAQHRSGREEARSKNTNLPWELGTKCKQEPVFFFLRAAAETFPKFLLSVHREAFAHFQCWMG